MAQSLPKAVPPSVAAFLPQHNRVSFGLPVSGYSDTGATPSASRIMPGCADSKTSASRPARGARFRVLRLPPSIEVAPFGCLDRCCAIHLNLPLSPPVRSRPSSEALPIPRLCMCSQGKPLTPKVAARIFTTGKTRHRFRVWLSARHHPWQPHASSTASGRDAKPEG